MAENIHVQNRLAEIRRKRRISAAALAIQADVRRQTIHAIEAGTYIPNTLVSLRLAQVLEVTVEDLFCLESKPAPPQAVRDVELLSSDEALQPGQPVRLCRVGKRMVGVPSNALSGTLPLADGVYVKPSGAQRAKVHSFGADDESAQCLLIAGSDPAVSILSRFMAKEADIELISANCSTVQAIKWLKAGKVHIAGSHLSDWKAGELNLPVLKKWFPAGGYKVVGFAQWEQGLVVAKGNPKEIRAIDDLSRKDVRLVNREKGSGSRLLLDDLLDKSGVDVIKIRGYNQVALGHVPAAWHVNSGQADCCLATRAAAKIFGLDFVPLTTERYDLIFQDRFLELPPVQVLMNVLNRSAFQHELETLGSYDITQTGRMLT